MTETQIKKEAGKLLMKSGFPVTQKELDTLNVNDFGLNNLSEEGCVFFDLLRTEKLRITILILLPNQTLPQHMHPAYEDEKGKEESVRSLWGIFKVYVEGNENQNNLNLPEGKAEFYTARKEYALKPGEQYTVPPHIKHWFQAGEKGAVAIAFQNRVNEDYNVFYDPQSTGCYIPKKNTEN